MNLAAKIACKTLGTVGMGYALYDTARVSRHYAETDAEDIQAAFIERAYFNSRTGDEVSYTSNDIRSKTFDLRTRNPLPAIYGKIKGGVKGIFYGLGNNLFTVAGASLAVASKGILAKIGATTVILDFIYRIFRHGYGVGKNNPMD